jgi:hypothetical protein
MLRRSGGMAGLPLPTRAAALASSLKVFAGWHLWMNCASCRLPGIVRVDDLILICRYGGTWLLGAAVDELRCDRCRKAPNWVRLADVALDQREGPRRTVQLVAADS